MMKLVSRIFCWTLSLLLACATGARAGATAAAGGEIAPGTKITMQNWRQFASYMPAGMQALFEGKSYWKMPQDVELVVGPTVDHPLPLPYRQATERYASQVRLVQTADGGLMVR